MYMSYLSYTYIYILCICMYMYVYVMSVKTPFSFAAQASSHQPTFWAPLLRRQRHGAPAEKRTSTALQLEILRSNRVSNGVHKSAHVAPVRDDSDTKNWSEIFKTFNSACGPAVFSMHSAQGRPFMLALRRPFHCILWFGRASQLVSNSRCCLPETPEKRSRKEKQMVHCPSPALRSCSTVNPASLRSSCDAQAKSLQEKPAVLTKTAKPKREL